MVLKTHAGLESSGNCLHFYIFDPEIMFASYLGLEYYLKMG